jgi:putative membrane protein (TIGR04086 family)
MDISDGILRGTVIFIYVLSAATGGIYIGKMQKEKKFLWGFLTGCLFFLILFLITL